MTRPAYVLLYVLIVVAPLVGLCGAELNRLPQDVRNLPAYLVQLEQARRHATKLAAKSEVIRRRIVAREEVISALLDGRLTLVDAAARFRELNAEAPQAFHQFHVSFPGGSNEERVCRQVIQWAHAALCRRSRTQADRLAAELEVELSTLLKGDGIHMGVEH